MMGGSQMEDNMTQTQPPSKQQHQQQQQQHQKQQQQHGSYNGAGITKREILEAYETKILDKDGEERSKGRNVVEGMAVDFLLTVQHSVKFCRVVGDVLGRSATGIRHWNPASAARAFGHIESYAVNLWDHPWKKAYKIIKLYSGFYKTQVDPHIASASDLFRMMGYEGTPNTLVMRIKSSREQLVQIAVESFLLAVECNIYYMILQRVEHLGYDVLDVHACRTEFAADIDASIEWITRNRKPFKRSSPEKVLTSSPTRSGGKVKNNALLHEVVDAKPDQRSKSGASVMETVSGIESVLCKNGDAQQQQNTPHSILRNSAGAGGKKGRVSADSGFGSKPSSKEITPIEENDAEEEEFPPPPPSIATASPKKVRKARIKEKENSPPGAGQSTGKKEVHALGTMEEHHLVSMKLLEERKKGTSPASSSPSSTEPSPIPPPRHSRSREWDHVTEKLKHKYGQEYYEGPRGDVLKLNDKGVASPTGGATRGVTSPASVTSPQGSVGGQSPGKEVRSPAKEVRSPAKEVRSPAKEVRSPGTGELRVEVHANNGGRTPLSPPIYSQAGANSRPLTVNIPPPTTNKRSVSPYDNSGAHSPGLLLEGATCGSSSSDLEYRTESFESKIKRPPSAEDLLEEVLKADEKYGKKAADFSTFGKRQPPPRPARNKKTSAARKSTYDNYSPPLVPDVSRDVTLGGRDVNLVGRGINHDEADFYPGHSHSLLDTSGAKTKRVSPDNHHYSCGYHGNGDYGFNVDVTSVANRRRHVDEQPLPPQQQQQQHVCTSDVRGVTPGMASAMTSGSPSRVRHVWQCMACTFANQPGVTACEMCGKSREVRGEGVSPLKTGGPQCPHCTLVNDAGTKMCKACDSDLTGCATYI